MAERLILGAVLAGGAARRFGSDKAQALAGTRTLIDHVIARLAPQCAALVVVGRRHGDWPSISDRPGGSAGPLAAINAALHHGAAAGFDAVLSAPCDMPDLPHDLIAQLGSAPAVLADHFVVGLWPTALAPQLDDWLAQGNRAVLGFARAVGAQQVALPHALANINTAAELADWCQAGREAENPLPIPRALSSD